MGANVSDLMSSDVISTNPEKSVYECAKIMVKNNIGGLPLVEDGFLKGYLTRKVILWAMVKKPIKDLKKIKAREVSIKKLYTLKPNHSIKEALSIMRKSNFERLPVIFENKIVGILSLRDILSYHPAVNSEIGEIDNIRTENIKLKEIDKNEIVEGFCEKCGNLDILAEFAGELLCHDCRKV